MTVKVWTLLITALLLVTGCSKSEVVTTYEQGAKQSAYTPISEAAKEEPIPVLFDIYTPEYAETRTINNTSDLGNSVSGFGVFAYYSNGSGLTDGAYNSSTSLPNFMFNEQVTGVADPLKISGYSWTYDPIKYWPNEIKSDGNGATSDHIDKLSFFAYAPWIAVTSQAAADADKIDGAKTEATNGIIAFSGNNYPGDPQITYSQPDNAGDFDLLCSTSDTKDLYKSNIGREVNFNFTPALARIGLVVTGQYDETSYSGNNINTNKADTYIKVESVTITPYYIEDDEKKYLKKQARLNLRTRAWEMISTSANAELGVQQDMIAENLAYSATGYNSATIQYGVGRYYNVAGKTDNDVIPSDDGTNRDQQLIKDNKYMYFIPADQDMRFKVKVKYHVYTIDPRMAGGWSHIVNEVESKDIPYSPAGEQDIQLTKPEGGFIGCSYIFKLVLGMTTLKASVSEPSYWYSNIDNTKPNDDTNPYRIPDKN